MSFSPTASNVLRVKNNEPNATVFTKMVNGENLKIQFAAKGYPGDTQRVPISLVGDVDFLNSVEGGILTVVDGPEEVMSSLSADTASIRAERQAAETASMESTFDRRSDRSLVGATCLGPAGPGRDGKCGKSIIQSAKQQGEVPPLCSQHQHLATNFVMVEAGSKGEGATESKDGVVRREWREISIGERRSSN